MAESLAEDVAFDPRKLGLQNWARHVLVQQFMGAWPRVRALDLSPLPEMAALLRGQGSLNSLVAAARQQESIAPLVQAWEGDARATIVEATATGGLEDLQAKVGTEPFHVALMFNGADAALASEEGSRRFLASVAGALRPGGYFVAIVPDSATVWYRLQKAKDTRRPGLFKGRHISVSMSDEQIAPFGTQYTMATSQGQVQRPLLHQPSLLRMAREAGLRAIDMDNLVDFYEHHRGVYGSLLATTAEGVDERGRVHPDHMALASFWMVLVFQKDTEAA